ncbi:MAG: LacI family DNA-binding transcriptional regulator [Candidatus Limnocylindrales bacterium]
MSTLNDVAKLAGVSTMTVSRVVNGSGYTSPEAQARVKRAIAELGYMPNGLARQLRSKRTKTIALVVTDIRNPFFTTIASGVEDTARARGYAVMFCNTYESDVEEAEYVRVLIERRVDGVLLVPAIGADKSLLLLQQHGMPTVILDRHLSGADADEVRADSKAGAYDAVRHLTDLGHRRIAILAGPAGVSTSTDRVAGYREALLEACPAGDCGQILFGEFNENSGYSMTREVLEAEPRQTAIFATNNFIAFGALRALREAGLRIPEDMSMVVFDDLPPGWVMDPFLTVVSQPAYEIGTQAAQLLLERLAGEAPEGPRSIVLPSELVIRRSTAPPRPD